MTIKEIEEYILDVPDFPKPGILFKDIMPLFENVDVRNNILDHLIQHAKAFNPEVIVGIESRGFFFGMLMANALNIPFIPIRKKGKLPGELLSQSYDLEYGTDHMEIQANTVRKYNRILIHDDVLATGGTCEAAAKLCQYNKDVSIGFSFLMHLSFLNGEEKVKPFTEHIHSVLTY